ncbi:hypothetical protein CRYUN_Cryun02cG0162400 [Craigia yunnanensis]
MTSSLIYVNEQYDGWKAECLNILRTKFDPETCSFAPDEEILDALQQSPVGQGVNLKQTQSLYMHFLKFKTDEVICSCHIVRLRCYRKIWS